MGVVRCTPVLLTARMLVMAFTCAPTGSVDLPPSIFAQALDAEAFASLCLLQQRAVLISDVNSSANLSGAEVPVAHLREASRTHVRSTKLQAGQALAAGPGPKWVHPYHNNILWDPAVRLVLTTVVPLAALAVLAVASLRCNEQSALMEVMRSFSGNVPESILARDLKQDRIGDGSRVPPKALWLLSSLIHCGCNTMFAISMPTSNAIAELAGGSLALSGTIIAAYAVGTLPCLPLCYMMTCRRVRSCFLAHALLALLGACLQALALAYLPPSGLLPAVVFARFIQGLSASVNYTGSLALTRACGPKVRTQYLFYWAGGGSIGIAFGPALSSFGEMAMGALFGDQVHVRPSLRLVGPPLVICAYAFFMLLAVLAFCPSDAELEAATDEPASASGDVSSDSGGTGDAPALDAKHATAKLHRAQALLGLAMIFIGPSMRTMIRVSWEATSILVVEQQGTGRVETGMLISTVGLWNAGALLAFGELLRCLRVHFNVQLSDYVLVTVLEVIGVLGMVLMLTPGTALFLVGSTIFYCANSLSGAPYMSFCLALSSRAGRSLLSSEGLMLANHFSALLMFFVAPIYTRHVASLGNPTASMLVLMLLPIALGQAIVNKVGMHSAFPLMMQRDHGKRLAIT